MNKKFMGLMALVAGVAITTFSVSGTYAKYVSTSTGTDKARVAKWGIGEEPLKIDLFDESYTNVANGSSDLKIIAPGTSGSYEFTLDPTVYKATEVGYEIKSDVTITDQIGQIVYWLTDATDGDHNTFASVKDEAGIIKYKSGGFNEVASTDISDLETAIEDAVTGSAEAGSALTAKVSKVLHWEWIYDGENVTNQVGGTSITTDAVDTQKGKEASEARDDNTISNVTMTVNITATQID